MQSAMLCVFGNSLFLKEDVIEKEQQTIPKNNKNKTMNENLSLD